MGQRGRQNVNILSFKIVASQGGSTLPIGTILPYIGALNDIPHGWFLCDGLNGTPDLRDRFLTCAGAAYTVGNTGGENFHQLTIEEMPSHNHSFNAFVEGFRGGDFSVYRPGGSSSWRTQNTGGSQAHENRPPFYAVYYIIKLK